MSDSAENDAASDEDVLRIAAASAERWKGALAILADEWEHDADQVEQDGTPEQEVGIKVGYHPCVGCGNLVPPDVEWCGGCPIPPGKPEEDT